MSDLTRSPSIKVPTPSQPPLQLTPAEAESLRAAVERIIQASPPYPPVPKKSV